MSLEVHLVVPGAITQVSGGYIYDRRILQGLGALGHRVVLYELPGAFPLVGEHERQGAEACLHGLDGADRIVIDGLALPAFEGCLERLPALWVALVHHPLALETGLPPALAAALEARERRMLRSAGRVIVTGRSTAQDVQDLGVEPARIGIVEPGTDRRPQAPAEGDPPTLLTVGALIPRKGQVLLLEALAGLRDLSWRLVLIGPTDRDPATTSRVLELIERHGLSGRIRCEGEVGEERLARAYAGADLFVLPSHYEGYGMALAEALAHGLPIVSSRAGAIPDTVPEVADLLVPPGDAPALRAALRTLLSTPETRLRLRDGARDVRQHLPTWDAAAAAFAAELMALGR